LRLVFALASVTIVTRRVPIEFVTIPKEPCIYGSVVWKISRSVQIVASAVKREAILATMDASPSKILFSEPSTSTVMN
jgi:hypothetical protein